MEFDEKKFSEVRERNAAMDLILHDRIIGTELFNHMCGDLLGTGSSRFVFEYRIDPKYVIKVDAGNWSCNNNEWQIWHEISEAPKMTQWFAPITKLTTCGRILLQRRCKTGIAYDLYPKKIPDFFTDLKYNNWGMLNGKMVCFDYANTKLLDFRYDYKLVNAKWWRE